MSEDGDVVDSENMSDLKLENISDLELENISDLELSGDVDMVYSWLVRNMAVTFSFGNISDTSFAVGDILL